LEFIKNLIISAPELARNVLCVFLEAMILTNWRSISEMLAANFSDFGQLILQLFTANFCLFLIMLDKVLAVLNKLHEVFAS